jgi:hypothetical protein
MHWARSIFGPVHRFAIFVFLAHVAAARTDIITMHNLSLVFNY